MVSKRLMLAREAVKAFNDGWLTTIARMSAPDVIYVDTDTGITALGPEDLKRVAALTRGSLPEGLSHSAFEETGNRVTVRSTVGETKEFVEIIEFDENDCIVKVAAHYGDPAVTRTPSATT